jgi:hypothetical protein
MPNPAPTTLLHFDGDNASTTFTDSASSPHTWTAVGNAQLTTTGEKFGSACLTLDGTGDYVDGDGSADFAYGTGDFTIEFWAYLNATGQQFLYDGRTGSTQTTRPAIYLTTASVLLFHMNNATRIYMGPLSTGRWYHISINRLSGSTKAYLDGTQVGVTYTDSNNYDNPASRPRIGAAHSAVSPFNGLIDEFLIIKGTALRTGNFTAPTGPYEPDGPPVTSGNNFAILHCCSARAINGVWRVLFWRASVW